MPDGTEDLSALKQAIVQIRNLRSEVERLRLERTEPIAVVGIGCRFPGGASGPNAFWQLLTEGFDAVTETPQSRWDAEGLYDSNEGAAGRIASKWGAFLDDVEGFDARFFGISPREAEAMDPQQRLVLETSWEALEHAGIAPDSLANTRTGVMVGIGTNDYAALQIQQFPLERMDMYYTTGAVSHAVASGRVSYVLGLNGPAVSVDTACSSSLMSVHLACQSLRQRDADVMLAGGVNVILAPHNSVGLSRAQMMASDGRCKTFDDAADGFVRAEGCGMVVLKRLSDARVAGDRILALIKGSAANQDGRSAGLTSPNGPSQIQVIRQALENAGVRPEQVGFVEAHGTGTSLGDPIEMQALGAALCPPERNAPLVVGSVKSNMGHLETAAGIAGLIKLVLSAHQGQIPANLHFSHPSQHIDWAAHPIEVPISTTSWQPIDGRRIGGVSSFGFSGTNVHIVVEDYPQAEQAVASRAAELYTLSAKSEAELRQLASAHADAVPGLVGSGASLADVSHTARAGRARLSYRASMVVTSAEQLVERLRQLAKGEASVSVHTGLVEVASAAKIGFVFGGEGSVNFSAARELYDTERGFRGILDRCDEALRGVLPRSLLESIFSAASDGRPLTEQAIAQPAAFAIQVALADLWSRWDIEPRVVHGYGLGEYSAACVAGVFSIEDGLRLTAERGRLLDRLPRDGATVRVSAPSAKVARVISPLSSVEIAAYESSSSTVVTGRADEIALAVAQFTAENVRTAPLPSMAAHSPWVSAIVEDFRTAASNVRYSAPRVPLISNLYGRRLRAEEISADYWCQHMLQPIRFEDGMAAMDAERCELILSVGGDSEVAAKSADGRRWLSSLRQGQGGWQSLMDTAGELFTLGQPIDLARLGDGFSSTKVTLPTYPFIHTRYWLDGLTMSPGSVFSKEVVASAVLSVEPERPGIEKLESAADVAFVDSLKAMIPVEREDRLTEVVRSEVARVLKTQDASTLNRRAGLMDLGLDSIMAVELRAGLSDRLQLDEPLPATLVMDYPNIDAIVDMLMRTFLQYEPSLSATTEQDADEADWSEREKEIESMSEAEVEALLMGKLAALAGDL